jgi:shikimate dehydrogenase
MPEAAQALKAEGFKGANVTMPHKLDAFLACDETTDDAARLRTVNTLSIEGQSMSGDNTDAPGFAAFLSEDANWNPAGRRVLLYGAGGAARACGLALARQGAAEIVVAVRDESRARDLAGALEGFKSVVKVISLSEASSETADLVLNATPLGMAGESLPLPRLGPETLVIDLVYHPESTPLLGSAAAAGAKALGGLGLLLHQAALSFRIWTGKMPDIGVLREAAKQQLEP